jgi:hypothetical protein
LTARLDRRFPANDADPPAAHDFGLRHRVFRVEVAIRSHSPFALFTLVGAVAGFVLLAITLSRLLFFPDRVLSSDKCAPAPCAAHNGLVLLISHLERDHASPAPPGFHYVRIEVSFFSTSYVPYVGSATDIALRDAAGAEEHADYVWLDKDCPPPDLDRNRLAPGVHTTDVPLCFTAAGPVNGPLTILWMPLGLADHNQRIETRLP